MKYLFLILLSVNVYAQNAGERGGDDERAEMGEYIFCVDVLHTHRKIAIVCNQYDGCNRHDTCSFLGMEVAQNQYSHFGN